VTRRSRALVWALSLAVGTVGGLYGIGGGSLLAPILLAAGLSAYDVAPATLPATFLTSMRGSSPTRSCRPLTEVRSRLTGHSARSSEADLQMPRLDSGQPDAELHRIARGASRENSRDAHFS
jgi:hypothetical protein